MAINIPTSMAKQMLAQNGMRVQNAAVVKFKDKLDEWAKEASINATNKAKESKRKTIISEDLE